MDNEKCMPFDHDICGGSGFNVIYSYEDGVSEEKHPTKDKEP